MGKAAKAVVTEETEHQASRKPTSGQEEGPSRPVKFSLTTCSMLSGWILLDMIWISLIITDTTLLTEMLPLWWGGVLAVRHWLHVAFHSVLLLRWSKKGNKAVEDTVFYCNVQVKFLSWFSDRTKQIMWKFSRYSHARCKHGGSMTTNRSQRHRARGSFMTCRFRGRCMSIGRDNELENLNIKDNLVITNYRYCLPARVFCGKTEERIADIMHPGTSGLGKQPPGWLPHEDICLPPHTTVRF